jgi:hypothetical protein
MKRLLILLLVVVATGCRQAPLQNKTVLLAGAYNMNGKCIGHARGLCGAEKELLPTEIAGVFATEPDCQGIRLRRLTDKERTTPGDQLPLLLYVYYEGSHTQPYVGTGIGENEGWWFQFNGPRGHFSAKTRTEQELVSEVCKATKGLGAEIDKSVGYTP